MGLVTPQIAKPAIAHPRDWSPPSTLVTVPQVVEGTTTDVLRPILPLVDVQTRRILSPDFESRKFVERTPRTTLVDVAEVAVTVAVAQAPHLRPRDIGVAATHQATAIERGQSGIPVRHNEAEVTTASPARSTAADTPRTITDEVLHAHTRPQEEVATVLRVQDGVAAPSHPPARGLASADAIRGTEISTSVAPLPGVDLPHPAVGGHPEAALVHLARTIIPRHLELPWGVRPRRV